VLGERRREDARPGGVHAIGGFLVGFSGIDGGVGAALTTT